MFVVRAVRSIDGKRSRTCEERRQCCVEERGVVLAGMRQTRLDQKPIVDGGTHS